ncbi:tRNA (N6-isopentenyl adenosine(37)-C2)-methylthiotransferase MiaB [Akkermansia sp. N21169]|uniref:tRNA (N6-isopentenyl adenosine(37)-C2)-methylthiotransferase MiaB n=1 Tax=unclassified Akkermansia TaxID=2608915 RepID=UPI00244E99B1|nr:MULTISPECIES: tRNA (N6-isopentenyl adenosine(37)-C2)-methylthiotransferase MiaB [unclassified Akkermansia]MDH3067592.1 tRNA (N6-isopentenyl adenosine(37)-C2)-methylthiotransferase MiaB [Akkermansia sp. N21169]WPX41056.1 tRNA (N6-isopentenyl adenosine(37)-C2)-methylthiotransferase MiaB [Akkermansia sp. N21116]
MPKVYIKTYGCQMNERDSEQVARMFIQGGYTITDQEEEADAILINTCSVRDQAEQKALGKMGIMGKFRKNRPHVVYAMMGCMAQSRRDELFSSLPHLDLVIGTQKYHKVFRYVDDILKSRLERRMDNLALSLQGSHVCDVDEEEDSQNAIRDHVDPGVRSSAFVSIMQGCDMKCSYCIVPYTRGAERSRPIGDVVDEVKMLVDNGVKEVTLLGQIVNRYGRQFGLEEGKSAFVRLLERIHDIEGLKRIRYTSPHPIGFRDDLVRAYTYLPKLCSHIHFPMQSGSDRILKLMRRPYRNEAYMELCEKMRAARPDLAITTDIIVGFPGETEEDYLETRRAVERIRYDNAFIFRYSPRRGTPAAEMDGQLPERVKEARNQDLLAVVNAIAVERNNALVGTEQEVLVEGPSKTNRERLTGRTSQNKPVILDGLSAMIGEIVPVKIEESTGFTLYGSVVRE